MIMSPCVRRATNVAMLASLAVDDTATMTASRPRHYPVMDTTGRTIRRHRLELDRRGEALPTLALIDVEHLFHRYVDPTRLRKIVGIRVICQIRSRYLQRGGRTGRLYLVAAGPASSSRGARRRRGVRLRRDRLELELEESSEPPIIFQVETSSLYRNAES
jgi:hypothetical protein